MQNRFMESKDYIDCTKLAISLDGDADTVAAIAGPMAYANFKNIPDATVYQAIKNVMRIIMARYEPWSMLINDKLHYFFVLMSVIRKKSLSLQHVYRICVH